LILFGNQLDILNFGQKIGIMKKTVLYLLMMVATFSLSSFGISDNPKATMTIQNTSKNRTIASKSSYSNSISVIPETPSVEKNKEAEKTKSIIQKFFSFVFSSIVKLVFGLISK